MISRLINKFKGTTQNSISSNDNEILLNLYNKYKEFTMIPKDVFIGNLELISKYKNIEGSVLECGVWKGGMVAAVSEILGKERNYYLFDSFEGLPDAKDIDGEAALNWQSDKKSDWYFDNCKSNIEDAEAAMKLADTSNYKIYKGWFNETFPKFKINEQIAVLRLDADWYDSTLLCMEYFFPKVAKDGLIIIDDYYVWDGCSKAIHDYLSKHNLSERISQSNKGICYIVKK